MKRHAPRDMGLEQFFNKRRTSIFAAKGRITGREATELDSRQVPGTHWQDIGVKDVKAAVKGATHLRRVTQVFAGRDVQNLETASAWLMVCEKEDIRKKNSETNQGQGNQCIGSG